MFPSGRGGELRSSLVTPREHNVGPWILRNTSARVPVLRVIVLRRLWLIQDKSMSTRDLVPLAASVIVYGLMYKQRASLSSSVHLLKTP